MAKDILMNIPFDRDFLYLNEWFERRTSKAEDKTSATYIFYRFHRCRFTKDGIIKSRQSSRVFYNNHLERIRERCKQYQRLKKRKIK